MGAVARQRIEMGRLEKRMPHESHRIEPMVIGEDEDDIARLRRRGEQGGRKRGEDEGEDGKAGAASHAPESEAFGAPPSSGQWRAQFGRVPATGERSREQGEGS